MSNTHLGLPAERTGEAGSTPRDGYLEGPFAPVAQEATATPAMPPFILTMPYEGDVSVFGTFGPFLIPVEFQGWREEVRSWKDGAYLGAFLSLSPTFRVKGPDAERFFSEHFVNNFANLKVGGSRHGIMCDARGRIMMDGTVLRVADDEFIAPRSLEILEQATGSDLHDVAFTRHRPARIGETGVRVYRLGMAGGLAYEVHGQVPGAQEVYNAIWAAGKPLGMRKLGQRAYLMNHTEDGFPQAYMHYPYPWFEDRGFAGWLDQRGPRASFMMLAPRLWGSVGDDLTRRYVTPFDTGWENRIHWDHEFTGKAALASIAADPPRAVVTLEWNADDIADVHASQYRGLGEEPYMPLDLTGPSDVMYDSGTPDPATGRPKTKDYHADLVLTPDGQETGISAGRIVSTTYRRMISLAFISREHADLGTELLVVWGNPGTRQKPIRATVARFPYLTDQRNDKIDVEQIPHYAR